MQDAIAGDHGSMPERGVGTIEARCAPARFTHEEDPSGHVPRCESELPECVEPATCHVAQIQCRGTGAKS